MHKKDNANEKNLTSLEQNSSRLGSAVAHFLSQRSGLTGEQQNRFNILLKHLSAALRSGHTCLLITDDDATLLQQSKLVSPDNDTPLVVDASRLYFQRYWHYECHIAQHIQQKIKTPQPLPDSFTTLLDHYFAPQSDVDEPDDQRLAAQGVAAQTFSIVTGGPGTGKTTTALRILALLQEIAWLQTDQFLHIALVAPTGKAAMRLQEAIGSGKNSQPFAHVTPKIKDAIPEKVSTIHRLLGAKVNSSTFKHNADNPLIHDLLVIDEASMVDLALMSKLLSALKPNARLILLGDKDQLTSVESGAVLGDLSQALPKHTLELKKTWRFSAEIKALATAINQQQEKQAWQLLQDETHPTLHLIELTDNPHVNQPLTINNIVIDYIMQHYAAYIQSIKNQEGISKNYQAFINFQVLCSNRKGKYGVEAINTEIERRITQHLAHSIGQQWYIGRPIMITRNNAEMHLYNGDIGICLADNETGQLAVYFQLPDGQVKKEIPARLPDCETVYAMTIHKSQGSEFNHVLLALPENYNPVLCKELIYTGVTRAKQQVTIVAKWEVFKQSVLQKVERVSGLQLRL